MCAWAFRVLLHACGNASFLYVRKRACLVYLKALNAETHFTDAPIIAMWDWLFDCFQGVSAKSLFCDYRLLFAHQSASPAQSPDFNRPGLSGGWAFDWQLVNDVISILLGKWSSGDSRLVSERGTVICYGWCVVDDGWRGRLQERGTARLSCLRRDWRGETGGQRGWRQTSQCGQLFITCTRRLMGQRLITFADTCSAV